MDNEVLDREVERQQRICASLALCADILRADVLYYELREGGQALVVEHAQPNSAPSVEPRNRKGDSVPVVAGSALERVVRERRMVAAGGRVMLGAARVHEECLPVFDRHNAVMGAVSVMLSDIEHERRNQNRNSHYRRAMRLLKELLAGSGLPPPAGDMTFRAHDGLMLVGADRRVRYLSTAAEGLYSRIGFRRPPLGMTIEAVDSGDERVVWQSLRENQCVTAEGAARDQIWLRNAIPLAAGGRVEYVLLLLRDVTAERAHEREVQELNAVAREIHHRVGNNLQTLISYTRVRARDAQCDETRQALADLYSRLFAVSQIHGYLMATGADDIIVKDVCRKIIDQVRIALLPADSRIRIDVEGDPLPLNAKQATHCVLIINELLQNAVEHAFDDSGGLVRIELSDSEGQIRVTVRDDGRGLPPGFDYRRTATHGLKIAHGLANTLRGELTSGNEAPPKHGAVFQLKMSRLIPGGN